MVDVSTAWMTAAADSIPESLPSEWPVAVGGELTSSTLQAAHRNGLLVLDGNATVSAVNHELYGQGCADGLIQQVPSNDDPWQLTWWSPAKRPVVVDPQDYRLGRGVTNTLRSRRDHVVTVDDDFDTVLDGCRDSRPREWMTPRFLTAVRELNEQGLYHGFSVRDGAGNLVGGAAAMTDAGVLSVDSVFGRQGVGIAAAAAAMLIARDAGLAADLQWNSPHVARMVTRFTSRADYRGLVREGDGSLRGAAGRTISFDEVLARLRGDQT